MVSAPCGYFYLVVDFGRGCTAFTGGSEHPPPFEIFPTTTTPFVRAQIISTSRPTQPRHVVTDADIIRLDYVKKIIDLLFGTLSPLGMLYAHHDDTACTHFARLSTSYSLCTYMHTWHGSLAAAALQLVVHHDLVFVHTSTKDCDSPAYLQHTYLQSARIYIYIYSVHISPRYSNPHHAVYQSINSTRPHTHTSLLLPVMSCPNQICIYTQQKHACFQIPYPCQPHSK